MTQDIGTAVQRVEDYPDINSMVYTVGNEQDYHFKVLFLILKKSEIFVLISYLERRIFDLRVSSAAIKSTLFKIFIALKVISSKFPIGVETRYKVPTLLYCNLQTF